VLLLGPDPHLPLWSDTNHDVFVGPAMAAVAETVSKRIKLNSKHILTIQWFFLFLFFFLPHTFDKNPPLSSMAYEFEHWREGIVTMSLWW
jgi:hypothetical protein